MLWLPVFLWKNVGALSRSSLWGMEARRLEANSLKRSCWCWRHSPNWLICCSRHCALCWASLFICFFNSMMPSLVDIVCDWRFFNFAYMANCEAIGGVVVSSSFRSSFLLSLSANQLRKLGSGNGCTCGGGGGVNCWGGRGVNLQGVGGIAKPEGRVSLDGMGSGSISSISDMSEFVSPSICSLGNSIW